MDPLSVAASIITIVQVANAITIICLDANSKSNTAKQNIRRILDDVSSLRTVLEGLARLLSDGDKESVSNLPTFRALAAEDGALSKCKAELEELQRDLQTAFGTRTGMIAWIFREKDVHTRLERITRIKHTLQLALAADQTTLALETRMDTLSIRAAIDDANNVSKRDSIIRWLGATSASSSLNDAQHLRITTTGNWFLKSKAYENWRLKTYSVLWLHGIPGSGKTVLCSSIIEDLKEITRRNEDVILAYYFFDFSTQTAQTVESFLRSLLAQIISQQRDISEEAWLLYDEHHRGHLAPNNTTLLHTLHGVLAQSAHVYLVVDAVDECGERDELLSVLEEITSWKLSRVHFLVSSRAEKDIEEVFTQIDSQQCRLEGKEVNEDIHRFVEAAVNKDRRLRKWPKDIQTDIISTVTTNAGEMFRWASCQLDTLRKCMSIKELRNALGSLPTTLNETYERILSGIDPLFEQDAVRILTWLCFAVRPPTPQEMVDFLAVNLETLEYDIDQRIQDPGDIITICGSLITRSHCGDNLKLSHYSVKEYLISQRILQSDLRSYYIHESAAHSLIAKTCLVYLEYYNMNMRNQDEASEPLLLAPFAAYSMNNWTEHFSLADDAPEVASLALRLLDSSGPTFLDWNWLAGSVPHILDGNDPHLSSVTKTNTLLFFAALVGGTDLIKEIMGQCVELDKRGGGGKDLVMASYKDELRGLELLLDSWSDMSEEDLTKPAAAQAWVEIAAPLIARAGRVNAWRDGPETSASSASQTRINYTEVADFLLKPWINSTSTSKANTELLCSAARNGLDRLNSYSQCLNRMTAPVIGDQPTLDLLISQHVGETAFDDEEGRTALHVAASRGSVPTVKYLLDLGVNVNQKDARGWCAMHYAACSSSAEIVKLLLPHWHFEPSTTENTWTPLHLACRHNQPEALDLLLGVGLTPSTVKTAQPEWTWMLYDIAFAHQNRSLVAEDGKPLHPSLTQTQALENLAPRPQLTLAKQKSHRCDGCQPKGPNKIYGPVFHCDECRDFDFCFICKMTAEESHFHCSWQEL